jgi:hypothetical protein
LRTLDPAFQENRPQQVKIATKPQHRQARK